MKRPNIEIKSIEAEYPNTSKKNKTSEHNSECSEKSNVLSLEKLLSEKIRLKKKIVMVILSRYQNLVLIFF